MIMAIWPIEGGHIAMIILGWGLPGGEAVAVRVPFREMARIASFRLTGERARHSVDVTNRKVSY
jgi:hypothetical protein